MTRSDRAREQAHLYEIEITRRDESGVAAYVSKGEKRYGVRLGAGFGVCSCPDSMYRGTEACKHQALLALHLQTA